MKLLLSFMLACFALSVSAKPSRVLNLSETDVGEIHTALGYSTILQFESRPSSAVLGDQDAFKIEYVGSSLTIKPVVPGARTNLFTFTDYDRFNFRLVTGSASSADYVVRVKRKGTQPARDWSNDTEAQQTYSESMTTLALGRMATCKGIRLSLDSLSYPSGKPWLVVNFSILNSTKEELEFKAEDLSLTAATGRPAVETLYLEALKVEPSATLHGSMLVKAGALKKALTFKFAPTALRQSACGSLKVIFKRPAKMRSS